MRFRALPLAVAALLATAANAPCQLPANPPTTLTAPIAATPTPLAPGNKSHRAQITFINGQLNVRADNSSLNLILREVARQTGMTITGGVADERVFGNYGPADPGTVLATLLDGTGSNMLLKESASNTPEQLVLTPRTGGVTPPNPNAPSFDEEDHADDDQPASPPPPVQQSPLQQNFRGIGPHAEGTHLPDATQSAPASIPQPMNNINGSSSNTTPTASTYPTTNSVPTDSLPTPSTTPSSSGIVDSANPPPANSTGPDANSPNGVKTPEDIFKQLQALQAQNPHTTTTTTTTTTQTTTPQQ